MSLLHNLHYHTFTEVLSFDVSRNQPFSGKVFPQQHEANRLSLHTIPNLVPGF